MAFRGTRKLSDGRELAVHANDGLRKICDCPRRNWAKCPHPWHFSCAWQGKAHRFSLDRHAGKRVESRTEAEALAAQIRSEIKAGTFGKAKAPAESSAEGNQSAETSFTDFADDWQKRRGRHLANAQDNKYRLGTICKFVLPKTAPPVTFGSKSVVAITTFDIEAFREQRLTDGLSAVAVNHDLRLLRKMFNWGVRVGLIEKTPFKIGTEPAITLEREIPRHKRFANDDEEERLLAAANPHLRAIITAILDTACRPGEVMSLQWAEVNLKLGEITITAEKEKTRRTRVIPISQRLLALLEMRKLNPEGKPWSADCYVFGNDVGEQVKSVRTAWGNACKRAGIKGLQLRDLRHEAASRFDEAGMPINYVSTMLGHSNLATTSRYLNLHRRGLHLAMEKYDESRRLASSLQADAPSQSEPAKDTTSVPAQNLLIS